MDKREEAEEKNKRTGWMVSMAIQLVLLVVFYFLVAWRAPIPPIPEYGIELSFLSTSAALNTEQSEQEQTFEPAPSTVDIKNDVSQTNEAIESDQVEEITEISHVEESEVEVSPQEESLYDTNEIEVAKQESVNPIQDVDNEEEVEFSDSAKDQSIDERALYGSHGTEENKSEGASLALAGWIWDFKPVPIDDSEEVGKLVYKIVVDKDGYLVKIETVISTVSPAVERKYRQAVEKLTFSKTSDYIPAALSEGTLTFIIRSK